MKAIMVALLACVMVPALALAQEGQAPGNLNTITGVNVTGGRVEIVGTKKPNFTTFTMTDPPRLVIDISEAVFSGVKEEITVGNGTITGIRTASYGSDDSAIARVLIGYEREVETDIQTSGNALVVSVAGSGGAPAVAERPAAAAPDTKAPAATATTPGATSEQAAVAAQADRQQQEKAAAQSAAAAQADRQQQEKAAAQSAAAAKAEAEAQRQAQARAEADRKAQEEAAKLATQQAQQAEKQRLQEERAAKEAAAAAEKQRQQDQARAAADEKKRQQADEKARREAEAQAAAETRTRQQDEARAAAEEKKRQAAEERQARLEEAQAAAEERQAAAEERKRQQAEARQAPRVAQAETPRRAPPEQGDSAGVSSRRKTMTLVGFKQEPTGSRVFVRTNEPVRYSVTENNRVVVLELENTSIAESNNTRSMNTSFFDTPVVSVDADVGPSRTVRVAIKLKEQATYETRQDGNEVSIEFQRSGP
ncbi:MAG TPA: AMIN domain-containing protein [Archangium sp.]|nr:AMIN domain-containing protein [Archangium sp.]